MSATSLELSFAWPERLDLFRLHVSGTSYAEAEELVIQAALERRSALVAHLSVHGLVHANGDDSFAEALRAFDLVCPDGQPVRWALNALYGTNLDDRVYGPDLMKRLCRRAAREGIGIYLYGSSDEVLAKLSVKLRAEYPSLRIAGSEAPPFRPLREAELSDAVERINASGAGLVFIGLGCPKQELFAYENRDRIDSVQLCVGAAFDFLADHKKTAPRWMQDHGLEWLYRLGSEPRRLFGRYLVNNSLFLIYMAREFARPRRAAAVRKSGKLTLNFERGE